MDAWINHLKRHLHWRQKQSCTKEAMEYPQIKTVQCLWFWCFYELQKSSNPIYALCHRLPSLQRQSVLDLPKKMAYMQLMQSDKLANTSTVALNSGCELGLQGCAGATDSPADQGPDSLVEGFGRNVLML